METGQDFELCEPAQVKRRQGDRRKVVFRAARLDVSQAALLPVGDIRDFLDENDPTFWLLRLQSSLPLDLFPAPSMRGGVCFDPRMMFTLWMLALWSRVTSSRELERLVRRDVRFIALAGGLRPDHSTLCRFRRSLGPTMDELLAHTVRLAQAEGLVRFNRAHLDGQRLPGNVSQWRKLCQEAEAQDAADEERESPPKDPPKGPPRPPSDPDARTIKTKRGYVVGYNAMALADEQTGIVVGACVGNSSSDGAMLDPTLESCLRVNGVLPEQVAADKGFDTPRNAYGMELLGVEGIIPAARKPAFSLDESGSLVCPAGHPPDRTERFKARGGQWALRQIVSKCGRCEQAAECFKGRAPGKTKTMRAPEDVPPEPWLRMHARARSDDGKAALKKRCCTVERVFAHTKTRLGFTRFALRGMKGASLEWMLLMVAHNLWRTQKAAPHLLKDLFALLKALTAPQSRPHHALPHPTTH